MDAIGVEADLVGVRPTDELDPQMGVEVGVAKEEVGVAVELEVIGVLVLVLLGGAVVEVRSATLRSSYVTVSGAGDSWASARGARAAVAMQSALVSCIVCWI